MNGFYNRDEVCLLRGTNWIFNSYSGLGKATSQEFNRRHHFAEFRVRYQKSPCGICGGHCGTRPDVSPSTSLFPCHYHLWWTQWHSAWCLSQYFTFPLSVSSVVDTVALDLMSLPVLHFSPVTIICGGHSGTRPDVCPSTSLFPCQYHLWWTQWHSAWCLSQYFTFPLSVSSVVDTVALGLMSLPVLHFSPASIICGGHSGTRPDVSPSTSLFPCQYHATNAAHFSSHICGSYREDKGA